jgi:hypothetical protein
MTIKTNAAGMCLTAEDCRALIEDVRCQPDDPVFGNATRDACRKATFIVVERAGHRDFTVIPVGSPIAKSYRLVDTIPATI